MKEMQKFKKGRGFYPVDTLTIKELRVKNRKFILTIQLYFRRYKSQRLF